MKLYTKTGDKGKTSIIGKERVDKDNVRIVARVTAAFFNMFFRIENNL